jgi:hypothetical protein
LWLGSAKVKVLVGGGGGVDHGGGGGQNSGKDQGAIFMVEVEVARV